MATLIQSDIPSILQYLLMHSLRQSQLLTAIVNNPMSHSKQEASRADFRVDLSPHEITC